MGIPKKTEFGELFAHSHYLECLSDERLCNPDYYKIDHDTWYLYRYGDGVKVVYLKYGKEAPKRKIEQNTKPLSQKEENTRLSQSVSRTKSTIFELAICNEFTHFCTFTQDENIVGDRFDLAKFRKDFAQFIRNENRGRENKIKYLVVPEQHKNGAWHFHGLLSGLTDQDLRKFTLSEKLPMRIKKPIMNGENVYNWDKYAKKFGFFTATDIKSHVACSKYITKYITKEVVKNNLSKGQHSYFASQGLKRRELILRTDVEPCPITNWGFENDYIKTAWFDNAEEYTESVFSDSRK